MRFLFVTFALLCALVVGSAAQQTNSSNDEPKKKESKNAEQTAKAQDKEKKPAEKSPEANPAEEQKQAVAKPGADKDKEEFDVAEVPPVVTHHQITLDGKPLKYTATTGRLPIKRERRQDRSRDVFRRLHARRPGHGEASADFRLQWRIWRDPARH